MTRCTSVSHEAKLASPPYTMRLNWPGSLLAAGGEARVHRWGRPARLRCCCGAARCVAALGPPRSTSSLLPFVPSVSCTTPAPCLACPRARLRPLSRPLMSARLLNPWARASLLTPLACFPWLRFVVACGLKATTMMYALGAAHRSRLDNAATCPCHLCRLFMLLTRGCDAPAAPFMACVRGA